MLCEEASTGEGKKGKRKRKERKKRKIIEK
jgi:hypothetical protein